ncbi:MAG: FGGY family carbohydrate kinase [Candidatus Binatia bacterium]
MHVLAIDEGTTGVRAMVFDQQSALVGTAYEEVAASYPRPGWMEQDPLHLWEATQRVVGDALRAARLPPTALAAVGIATQRATTLVWDRRTGLPVYPAISWQDGRTAARVPEVLAQGVYVNAMASATKLEWILRERDAPQRAAAGDLCFGTVDTWLAWQLSGGRSHVTDHGNASCTGLYDFSAGTWDANVLAILGIPAAVLPAIVSSSAVCGETDAAVFGAAVPLAGRAGDQQAAMFGELCVEPRAVKITFGTSAMIDLNTGEYPVLSQHGAYPLILWEIGGQRTFCLEGTVMTAGAAVQWLRDGLGIISNAAECGPLAASVPDSGGVWAVPAFQGLGTPHLDPGGRAVIGGLSRGSTRAHIVRAVLEGVAFRTREALDVLLADAQFERPARLRVDGGAAANDFFLQSLADTLGIPVERPEPVQATALGAAYLAGLAAGVWKSLDDVRHAWRSGGVFTPRVSADERESRFAAWQQAISAAQLGAGPKSPAG